MSACRQPGCTGTVEDDGLGNLYRDTCGMALRKATAPPSAKGPERPGPSGPGRSSRSSRSSSGRIASRRSPNEALLDDLQAAAEQLERLGLDSGRHETLAVEILGTALEWVVFGQYGPQAGGHRGSLVPGTASLLGHQPTERGLRFGLEWSFRVLARLAQQGRERIELVERANLLRPRTWV